MEIEPRSRTWNKAQERLARKLGQKASVVSLLFHLLGFTALAAWPTIFYPSPAQFAGSEQAVQLSLSFSEPQLDLSEVTVEDFTVEVPVLIEPQKARVGERKYVYTPTGESSPEPELLEIPTDLVSEPPPPSAPKKDIPEEREEVVEQAVSKPPSLRPRKPSQKPAPQSVPTPPSSLGNSEDTPPDLSQNMPPTYPASAIRSGLEGTVVLRLWISAKGEVTQVEVARTSGFPILDHAAVTAVRHWSAKPGHHEGQPVATVELLPVSFRLRK